MKTGMKIFIYSLMAKKMWFWLSMVLAIYLYNDLTYSQFLNIGRLFNMRTFKPSFSVAIDAALTQVIIGLCSLALWCKRFSRNHKKKRRRR